jgi:uncharacterized membrane protein
VTRGQRSAVFAVLGLLYPAALWALSGRVAPRWLALGLVALGVTRLLTTRQWAWAAAGTGALALAALAAALDVAWPLKLYPVVVNAALLAVFGATLLRPPSLVERLARLREPSLPPHAVAYTRRVTQVWCGFFVLNGAVAAATALGASDEVWALYNGGVAYGLMGLLFAGEWVVRGRVRRRAAGGGA